MSIPVTTSDTIPGKVIDAVVGPVVGVNVYQYPTGVKPTEYTKATHAAIADMTEGVVEGQLANAVVGLRITTSALFDNALSFHHHTVIAYGTAVTVRDSE